MASSHGTRLRADAARTRCARRSRAGTAPADRCDGAVREARHDAMVGPSLRTPGDTLDHRLHTSLNDVRLVIESGNGLAQQPDRTLVDRAHHEDRLVSTGLGKVAKARGDAPGGAFQRPHPFRQRALVGGAV